MPEQARTRIGCSGWHYNDWRGAFYDDKIATEQELGSYAVTFDTVEIDSTFYGKPHASTVQQWAQRTPARFRFSAKIPRAITHEGSFADTADQFQDFCDTMRGLGPKLAALLIQLPPSFTAQSLGELEDFLDQLPTDIRFAVEVRHRSLHTEETYEMLRHHRVAWVISDMQGLPVVEEVTADFSYVRWLGNRDEVQAFDRETIDRSADLLVWRDRILALQNRVADIFGYFNNHYSGHAPACAQRFKELIGLPSPRRGLWAQANLLDGLA
jgi:uncharacterized protein YecE (DUF72 family)